MLIIRAAAMLMAAVALAGCGSEQPRKVEDIQAGVHIAELMDFWNGLSVSDRFFVCERYVDDDAELWALNQSFIAELDAGELEFKTYDTFYLNVCEDLVS